MASKKTSRKSSILKPQKGRKPLGDVDLGKEDADEQAPAAGLNKSSRRVSFASNNFVKPFVADSEQNTIWDLTYEEAVASDTPLSMASAQEEEGNVIVSEEVSLCELDFTPPVDAIINEEENVFEDMELTNPITDVENKNLLNDMDGDGDMEFTAAIYGLVNAQVNKTADDSMEFTKPVEERLHSKTILYENVDITVDQSYHDDTEKLINYEVSGDKRSDFSKVMTGDFVPAFSNWPDMPLRGINSTSFVQGVDVGANPEIVVTSPTRTIDSDDLREETDKSSGNRNEVVDMEWTCVDDSNANRITSETSASSERRSGIDEAKTANDELETTADSSVIRWSTKLITENRPFILTHLSRASSSCGVEATPFIDIENCSLMCNTPPLLTPDSSPIQGNSKSPEKANLELGELFSNREACVFDRDRASRILDKARNLIVLCERASKNCMGKLEAANSRFAEQIAAYNHTVKMLDDFDSQQRTSEEFAIVESSEGSSNEPEATTWKEKVMRLSERNEGYWSIMSLDSNPYRFNTLYETLEFSVDLSEDEGQVLKMDMESQLDEKSEPIAFYIHKIFVEKLQMKHIRSALGEKFEILSLLDYVRLTMEKLLEINTDYTLLGRKYAVDIDREFKLTFALISVEHMFSWRFAIDLSDYDNIDKDKVSYFAKAGSLRERDIQRCLNACPKGFGFVRVFIESLYAFLQNLESR